MATDKLHVAVLLDRWRRVPSIEQVALINMADVWVRSRVPEAADLGEDLMVIMVQALCGVGSQDAKVIVDTEIQAAHDRKGR